MYIMYMMYLIMYILPTNQQHRDVSQSIYQSKQTKKPNDPNLLLRPGVCETSSWIILLFLDLSQPNIINKINHVNDLEYSISSSERAIRYLVPNFIKLKKLFKMMSINVTNK